MMRPTKYERNINNSSATTNAVRIATRTQRTRCNDARALVSYSVVFTARTFRECLTRQVDPLGALKTLLDDAAGSTAYDNGAALKKSVRTETHIDSVEAHSV